jgi:hypothetical protein
MATKNKTRSRKPYAWERGIVPSSIPAGERMKKCAGCKVEAVSRALKYGYCAACWKT